VVALVLGGLAALTPPASSVASSSSFTQPQGVFLGESNGGADSADVVTFAAGGGTASVYPSVVSVPHSARIVDVDVDINEFRHTNPDDVQLVLVQDGGPQVTLMANAGGSDDTPEPFGTLLTFDDEAQQAVPDESALEDGSYRPAAYGTVSQLPAPAPTVTGNTSLSVFDGLPLGTTWSLYAFDDDGSDFTGSFSSWELNIEYATNPYPSELTVSGAGVVQDLDVTLHGFTSTFPADVDLLLVGPSGAQAILMSDVSGSNDATGIELTLDDEATEALPDSSGPPLTSGAYRPTNPSGGGPDLFPAPAPGITGLNSLAAFDGTNANGTWRLFAVDDSGGDETSFAGGWSLHIDWDDSTAPTGSVSVAGQGATKSAVVTLELAASDAGTGVTQMRFSNDGHTWSAFRPYAAKTTWTLGTGDGTKTVRAQFRDAIGNVSTPASDTVLLDTTSPTAKKVKPQRNARDVGRRVRVRVVVTEALDPTTLSKQTAVLKRNGVRVKSWITYIDSRRTIVLKPRKPLKSGDYRVVVKTSVTDVVGNRFDASKKAGLQQLTWTFTVG
jgi:subtilisin-like proprotein convertase family protein